MLLRQRTPDLEPAVEKRIFDSTQGNPLFVQEMGRLVGEQGAAALVAGALPEGVREVIRQRLERLAPEARRLLDLAAVAGRRDRSGAAGRRLGPAAAGGGRRSAGGSARGRAGGTDGRRRFAHDLMREVLYSDLAPADRQALHGAVAAALEKLRGADPVPPLAELAHHGFAGPPDGIERAVDHAVRAAQRSLALAAYEEAVSILERAAAAVENVGNPAALRARVLRRWPRRTSAGARPRPARPCAGRWRCWPDRIGDSALLARAALTYGLVFTPAVVDPVLVQMLEESLEALPAEDSALRVQLLARLGGAMQPMKNDGRARPGCARGDRMARRLGRSGPPCWGR